MKIGALVSAVVLLTGCATKAYRAVESECAPQAWADYPENKVQVVQTRQRVIYVSTGMRSCFSTRDGAHTNTICNDITRPEYIPYQETWLTKTKRCAKWPLRRALRICACNATATPNAKPTSCWSL